MAESSSEEKEIQLCEFNIRTIEVKKTNVREVWASSLDFFLSALGYAVGIGNVWRFPYMCYKNGGGVFLIPYFVCMFLMGIPLVYLEFIIGQFTSSGPLTAYKMTPLFRGIGLSINFANAFRLVFFNMIIGYAFYFFVKSFTFEDLPWAKCNPEWASPNCVDNFSSSHFNFTSCSDSESLLKCDTEGSMNFGRCFKSALIDGTLANCSMDRSLLEQTGFWKTSFPSQDYWNKIVLKKSSSIEEPGNTVWSLVACYIAIIVIVYIITVKGIKVSGKVAYFTALFPYCVLLILGFRGWSLPGASIGIKYYIIPRWEKLFEAQVWTDAATAIFFSISLSFGGMTTLASYNKFNTNIMKDAITIPLVNCLTSFFAGFVIFSYMGYLSHATGQDIDNIIEAGQGLAFVVYPYAVTTLVGAPQWSILFFLMLMILGISSQVSNIEITITSILDAFPILKYTKLRRYLTVTGIFVVYSIIGVLMFTKQNGSYWIEVFNRYTGDWAILFIGATLCLVVSYLYGPKNLRNDIFVMLGAKYTSRARFNVWYFLWAFVSPMLCLLVGFSSVKRIGNITIGGQVFPDWTLYFGQIMQINVCLGILGGAVYSVIKTVFIDKKKIISVIEPDFDNYIPKLAENQKLVRIQRGQETTDEVIQMKVQSSQ